MDMIAFGLLASAAVLVMAFKGLTGPPLLALAMTHLLQLSGSMQWAVRQTTEAENHMTSVERLLAYCALPQERRGGAAAPRGGGAAEIRFEAVEVRCAPLLLCARRARGGTELQDRSKGRS